MSCNVSFKGLSKCTNCRSTVNITSLAESEGDDIFAELNLTVYECDQLMKLASAENRRCFSAVEALIIPVRTKNLELFAKDLFAPTFFRVLNQTEYVAAPILEFIGSIIVDLITLPIRLITALPRYLTSESIKQNEFYQELVLMLKNDDLFQQIIKRGFARVSLKYYIDGDDVEKFSYSFYHRFEQMRAFKNCFDRKLTFNISK